MLTDAQKVDVRRWLGYPTLNEGQIDPVYSTTTGVSRVSLTAKLDGLTASEEVALTDRYLTPLASLEADLLASTGNMDTQAAGPWIANPRETQERTAMYNKWRRDMCGFLGIPPGPALGSGGISVARC